jgi:xylulokinase
VPAARSGVIGLDIGTSAVKGLLVDGHGQVLARSARALELDIGPGGRVEVDARRVASAARRVIATLAARAGIEGVGVRALCAGGSGDEAVWVDRMGVPVAPVPLSLDTRGAAAGEAIAAAVGRDRYLRLTGLPASGAYPVARLLSLRRERPDLAARVTRLLSWPEALALDLGVGVRGEPTLAARSGAWRIDVGTEAGYEPALLVAASGDLSAELFPPVVPTGSVLGVVPEAVAETIGLPRGVRFVGGGFDQAMATLGAGIASAGLAHVGAGSWQALTVLADDRPDIALVSDGFTIGPSIAAGGRWSVMGSGPGASLLGWLGRVGGSTRSRDDARRTAGLARRAADRPTGLLVVPDLGGGAPPRPDPEARGAIVGLSLGDGPERLARALLESIAIGLADRLARLGRAGLAVDEVRVTGGGGRDRRWRQLTADVTGLPVRAVEPVDAGAMAAAALAATAVGLASDVSVAIARTIRIGPPVRPRPAHHATYRGTAQRSADVRSALRAVQRTATGA